MATFTNQQGTHLGPLPTAWTRPSDCAVHMVNCATCDEGFAGQTCVLGDDGFGSASDYTGCWPPVTERAGTPRAPFLGWGFYSPGLECPTGYTGACTARFGLRPEWDIQFRLHEGETAVGCCPDGFQCANRNGNTCILIASTEMDSNVVVATGSCSGTVIDGMASATFPDLVDRVVTATDDSSAVETVQVVRQITLLAPMIQYNFRSSDLSALVTGTGDSRAETASATSSTEHSPTTPPASDSGLSSRTIGGIVAGVVGGLLAIAVAVWFILRQRRRRQQSSAAEIDSNKYAHAAVSQQTERQYVKHDLFDSPSPVELGGKRMPSSVFELPADQGRGYVRDWRNS